MSYTTRSGRAVRKPIVYVPQEVPEDDFKDDDYDDDDPDGTNDELLPEDEDEEEETEDEDEDADEHGNLRDFVVEDETDEDDCD